MAAPLDIAKACDTLQGQITSGASSISQLAALRAVKIEPCTSDEMKEMIATFKERRDLLIEKLDKIPGMKTNQPDGAFYVFANVAAFYGKSKDSVTIRNDVDFCMYALEKALVALVPGGAFGNADCVRFSYATSTQNLIEAADRIKQALAELS